MARQRKKPLGVRRPSDLVLTGPLRDCTLRDSSVDIFRLKCPEGRTYEELERFAVTCVFGEETPMAYADVYLLRQMWGLKPDVVSTLEWCQYYLRGRGEELLQAIHDPNVKVNLHPLQQKIRRDVLQQIHAARHHLSNKLADVLNLQLDTCRWDELAECRLRPITCSFFMLHSRPCEHVVLSPQMLRWLQCMPWRSNREKEYVPQPVNLLTDVAPETFGEYRHLEWWARLQQRLFFPWATSLQAEALILMGGKN